MGLWRVAWVKKTDTYYTDAIHLIKYVEDQIKNSRKPLSLLVFDISVKRLSDNVSSTGLNLKKEYYAARSIFDITKSPHVANLLDFLHENKYDFDQAKTDLRASEKTLKGLMGKWKEHILSLKNQKSSDIL